MDRFLLGSEPCSIQAGELAQVPTRITSLYTLLVASLMVYFIGAAVYWRRAFLSLREKPYNQMRMAHQHLRLSVRVQPTLTCPEAYFTIAHQRLPGLWAASRWVASPATVFL